MTATDGIPETTIIDVILRHKWDNYLFYVSIAVWQCGGNGILHSLPVLSRSRLAWMCGSK